MLVVEGLSCILGKGICFSQTTERCAGLGFVCMCTTQRIIVEIPCSQVDPDALLQILVSKQAAFEPSRVRVQEQRSFSRRLDYDSRNSLSYKPDQDLYPICDVLKETIYKHLDNVVKQLQLPRFKPGQHEVTCVAFGNGAFFRKHRDVLRRYTGDRRVSWVYYVSRKPAQFSGGELVFYNREQEIGRVVPESGKLVVFRSDMEHEVEPVVCPTDDFADYRFTVTGFLYARPTLIGTILQTLWHVMFPLRNFYPVRKLGRLARRVSRTSIIMG